MKLRKVENYDIGLDLGTTSMGWAVVDSTGELCSFKGKPTWGSRIFTAAETAAAARIHRGQRRRYERRRQRLNLLQSFFAEEIEKVDPSFFIRLNQSALLKEDRKEGCSDYRWPLFNGDELTEKEYYKTYPTIYHLRCELVQKTERADIRFIYLALHNMVKHRGNFLYQNNPNLSAKNANMEESIHSFAFALEAWCERNDISLSVEEAILTNLLEDTSLSKREKQEKGGQALNSLPPKMAKAISQAFVGYTADFNQIFLSDLENAKFKLSEDEKVDEFLASCPDDALELFESIQKVYSSFVLSGILKDAQGETLSACKVHEYSRYGEDLKLIKSLAKDYVPDKYKSFFCGETYENLHDYDPAQAKGYTRYNMGPKKSGSGAKPFAYDDFKKEVVALFKDTQAVEDPRYLQMMASFEEGYFLRRLKTSDNGSIPYQLHLEEMLAIIQNQAKYYPFLSDQKVKLQSLIEFRIPYYVGPLTDKNAALDSTGKSRFAWSTRLPGKEKAKIYPWNWDEIIDKHACAESFITRMTGMCTYLPAEPVLPKASLLYEEFCVLNELNGARWTQDGDDFRRFDQADRKAIVSDLFRKGSVSYKKVEEWLASKRGHIHAHVKGGQGENKFESRLSSYIFFCKDVFGVDELPQSSIPMVEEIILWSTLFEDRSILRDKLTMKYGDKLSKDQIKTICKKRLSRWGRLSRKLLNGLRAESDCGPVSIMEILRDGNPNNSGRSNSMILMETLHDDKLKFLDLIDQENKNNMASGGVLQVEDLPGSPALKRTVNQAVRLVEEIVSITGKAPNNIFVEVTREEDERNKAKRTTQRYERIKKALAALKKENCEWWDAQVERDFKARNKKDLNERLTLYFMQNGKCLYSGKPIDIDSLSDSKYQVDHILPQAYIKDDSYENKALVLSSYNQEKSDSLLLKRSVQRDRKQYWNALHEAGLIGDKKYKNLLRDRVSDKELKGFIARQLVETSQIVKFTQMLLEARYEETRVLPIKASFSSQLRKAVGQAKCREINDYHHAHDALRACTLGRFIQTRHPDIYDNPLKYTLIVRNLIRSQSDRLKQKGRLPGSSSFIVASFLQGGFNKNTGEIVRDTWDPDFEIARMFRFLNYRDCFISTMPEETGGAFWKETIYSPRKEKILPMKQNLDPKKYGGYSTEQFAYFFVYKALNKKTKESMFEFGEVPIRVATSVSRDPSALEDLAKQYADEKNLKFIRIARSKIYKKQLFELNGNRFFIMGKEEIRNGIQFAFSQEETKTFERLANDKITIASKRQELFSSVMTKYKKYAQRLGYLLKIEEIALPFGEASTSEQKTILLNLASIAAAKKNKIDLRLVGGVGSAGQIKIDFSKKMSSPNSQFVFIDQSLTGMFERRERLEL